MATLVLGIAGSAAGGALLPSGLTMFGSTLTGAAIGGAAASIGGAFVDQALLGPLAGATGLTSLQAGPRLSDVKLGTSSEGTPIPRVYGRVRIPGQLIWATRFKEEKRKVKQANAGGGKNVGITADQSGAVEYRYYANVAYALCEGPILGVTQIWADGKKLKQKKVNFTVHLGTEDQEPDAFIESKEGAGKVPAYRGVAYIVFKEWPLEAFGNRLPVVNFEVIRAFDPFEEQVRAVTVIPGAGEFIYDPEPVIATTGGVTVPENVHQEDAETDAQASAIQLAHLLPNVRRVSLVVTWFGTDLRIRECEIRPGVETALKTTEPYAWRAGGVDRSGAHVVSQVDGRPAYGGTPSDISVGRFIQAANALGIDVTVYPFIAMDVPAGNALPNPYTGETGQPAHPWRGRITCDPAPGQPGSADKTGACAAQVAAFVGSAEITDFSVEGTELHYSGPDEWSYRRFILHCAAICAAAGGVDGFIIGSELRGATRLRSDADTFPFVDALVDLAAEVKAILPTTKIIYAADWTEHPAYVPDDGSGDVYFHLDPLWTSPNIDAVGIDCYWPLADWRDGEEHLDWQPGRTIYDLDYLRGNVQGGEAYDFYYPSGGETGNEASAERIAQERLPIEDGAYGKPWVFRPKAIKDWWQNQHFNRPGGVEAGSPTEWVPRSKSIWFTELGCAAVDKGANQPNVFIDPKSSESFAPYFSRATRDDLIQRRYLQAMLGFFDPEHADYAVGSNPVSSVYAGRMLDLDRAYVWTWDARPYPTFPQALSVWSDGVNWERGHWLTGRIGGGAVASLVGQLLQDYGFTRYETSALQGSVDGFVIDRLMSAREALQPLSLAYFFDAYESGGVIRFKRRGVDGPALAVTPDDVVEIRADDPLYSLTRGQETELPVSAKITYINVAKGYQQGSAEARRLNVRSGRVSAAELPIVMRQEQAEQIAESWLHEAWSARERASFALPPSELALEPTDVVTLEAEGRSHRFRITETRDAAYKAIEARAIEPRIFEPLRVPARDAEPSLPPVFGPASAFFLDLPLFRAGEAEAAGYVAGNADPWPGAIAFLRSPGDSGFILNVIAELQPTFGETVFDFYSGPLWRHDRSNALRVTLARGELTSVTDEALLAGANLAAVKNGDGAWELFQFATATLVAPLTYDLSGFLRGQFGTEGAMGDPVSAGASFVLLDEAVVAADMTRDDVGLPFNWRFGPVNEAIDDISYKTEEHAFTGLGLRPYAPAQLRGIREPGSGDWALSWIRRTRTGGDSWEQEDVPLGEESELYDVEILDAPGGSVLRTASGLSAPVFDYAAAEQVADFGSTQASLDLRVFQRSATYGRGAPAEAAVYA